MPPKLTVNDYTFYFVPDINGKYLFGLKNPKRGNVFRRTHEEFNRIQQKARDLNEDSFVILFAISNICEVETGKHTLVYDIYEDLRDEEEVDANSRD